MDENLHNMDDLFRNAIEQHKEDPPGAVWDHLDKNLSEKQVISISERYRKLKWTAAVLLVFSAGMAMYSLNLNMKYTKVVRSDQTRSTRTHNAKGSPGNTDQAALPATAGREQAQLPGGSTPHVPATDRDSLLQENNYSILPTRPGSQKPVDSLLANAGQESMQGDRAPEKKVWRDTKRAARINRPSLALTNTGQQPGSTGARSRLNPAYAGTGNEAGGAVGLPVISAAGPRDLKTALVSAPAGFSRPALMAPDSVPPDAMAQHTQAQGPPPVRLSTPSRYSVQAFYSAGQVSTHLVSDRPYFREDDRQQIKNSEGSSRTYNVGIAIERQLGEHVSIGSGISLVSRSTDIYSKYIYARPDRQGNINYRVSCSSGYAFISAKSGTLLRQGDSIRSLSSTNTVQYLSVPASVRLRFTAGKFSFNPLMALSANARVKARLETTLSYSGGGEHNTSTAIYGLNSVYFDGTLKMDLAYNVYRNVSLNVIPAARLGLTPITHGSPVKTYVNTLDLGFGLSVKL